MELKLSKKLPNIFSKRKKKMMKPILFSPLRFWRRVLFIGASLALLSLSFGVYIFYKISIDDYMNVDESEQASIEPLNRKKLESVLNRYDEKMRRFNEVETTKPLISDPSL